MPLIRSAFRPAWWLRNPHAQTLWPTFFRSRPAVHLTWERLELNDGDFIDLAWAGPTHAPTVMLLHGLEGGVDSHYATGMTRSLNEAGFRVCLMLFRGRGREPNRLPISYHSGKTDDLEIVVDQLTKRLGSTPFGAVGVSLGGNVLLKWLGERGDNVGLQRAAAVSVPFRLGDCARRLEQGASRLYQRHLIGRLQASYQAKFERIPSPLDVDVTTLRTFCQFDDRVTAALHGFKGVEDYYARCSSRAFIPSIRIPTLILHASDDPFMYPQTAPTAQELPAAVWLELADAGGHVGFIGGSQPGRAVYYADRRITAWMTDPLP